MPEWGIQPEIGRCPISAKRYRSFREINVRFLSCAISPGFRQPRSRIGLGAQKDLCTACIIGVDERLRRS